MCENFLVRSIATLAINLAIARIWHIDILYKDSDNFKILFIRNFNISIQAIIFTIAQYYLAQPIISTINNTGPLIVFILDYFINRVTITRKQFYGVILGILGAILTVNGEFFITFINPNF